MENLILNKTAFEMVQTVVPFAKKLTNFALRGVYLYDEGNVRNYVCTDGHILIEVQAPVQGESIESPFLIEMEKEINLKKHRLDTLAMMCVRGFGDSEEAKFSILDNVYKLTREYTYPHYRKAIPDENTPQANFYTMFGSEYIAILKRLGDLHCVIPQMKGPDFCAMWKRELDNDLKLTVCLMPVRLTKE